jgi:hypothetical protein
MKSAARTIARGTQWRSGIAEMVRGATGSIPPAAAKSRFGGFRLAGRNRTLALADLATEQVAEQR